MQRDRLWFVVGPRLTRATSHRNRCAERNDEPGGGTKAHDEPKLNHLRIEERHGLFDGSRRPSGAARLETCLLRLPQSPLARPTDQSLNGNRTRWKRPAARRWAVEVGHNIPEAGRHSHLAAGRGRPLAARCSWAGRRKQGVQGVEHRLAAPAHATRAHASAARATDVPASMLPPAAVVLVCLRRGARRDDAQSLQCRHSSRDYTHDRFLALMRVAGLIITSLQFDCGRMLTSFRLLGPKQPTGLVSVSE